MNFEWARTWLEKTFNQGDMEAFGKLYARDVKFEDVPLGVRADDLEGTKSFLSAFTNPDAGTHRFYPEAYLGDASGGVVEWTWEGTMGKLDPFGVGKPVEGKKFRCRGNSVFRFGDDGKIVEERDYWDLATILKQLK